MFASDLAVIERRERAIIVERMLWDEPEETRHPVLRRAVLEEIAVSAAAWVLAEVERLRGKSRRRAGR